MGRCDATKPLNPMTISPQNAKPPFWLLAILIILVAVLLRIVNLTQYPISSDEILHILRIYNITAGEVFSGLDQNKWFYGYVVALFQPSGPESIWLARYVNVLWATINVACCIQLGRRFHSWQAGLLAGLFYAIATMGIYHERRAVHDPQMTAAAMVAFILMINLARRPKISTALLMTAFLLLARITKPAMVGFFALPFAAIILLQLAPDGRIPSWAQIRQRITPMFWKANGYSLLGVLVVLGITEWIYQMAANQGVAPRSTHTVSLGNTILAGAWTDQSVLLRFLIDLRDILFIHLSFWSLGVVICALLAVTWMVITPKVRTPLLLLSIPALVYLLIPVMAVRPANDISSIFPRYLVINGPALCALAAIGLVLTYQRYLRGKAQLQAILTALVALPTLAIGALWMFEPTDVQALLPWNEMPYDSQISWFGKSSFARDAYHIIAEDWLTFAETHDRQPSFTILTTWSQDEYQAYFGPRFGPIIVLNPDDESALPFWVARSDRLYVVEDEQGYALPDYYDAYGLTEVLFSEESSEGLEWLWRVDQLNSQPADAVYGHIIAQPESMSDDYNALLPQIGTGPLYTFPANHAAFADTLTAMTVQSLSVGVWPMEEQAAEEAIQALGTDNQQIGVILIQEAGTDPQRYLLQNLYTQNLYPYTESWSGVLHYIGFATGPEQPQLVEIDAEFEGVITLEQAALLDEEVQAGQFVRVAYQWKTNEPIQDDFAIFTHILAEDGTLLAQYDGEPGRGLFPTSSWEPGEPVSDQFALRLPPDAAAGTYTVRVGLYNPANNLRLQATAGDSEANAIAVGRIVVK